MARYTGPKQRLQRQIGEDLGLKTNALRTAKRIGQRPGQHGAHQRRKISNYGIQLKEKQKIKYIYGLMEKQLRSVYEQANKSSAATGAALLVFLERRIDNVIYRLGWAPTRPAARQMVSHGQVMVNAKKMSIPSFRVSVDDVIVLKTKATKIPAVADRLQAEPGNLPAWLERKQATAKIVRYPDRDDIAEKIDEQLLVEFYSR